jgi:hypothetical protein
LYFSRSPFVGGRRNDELIASTTSQFPQGRLLHRGRPFSLSINLKGKNEMQTSTYDSLVEAAVDLLNAGISEEALPLGLAPLFAADPFDDAVDWSIR